MKYLLDTHTFLWSLSNDPQLKPDTKKIVKDKSKVVFLSVISVWEIVIKVMAKKLQLDPPVSTLLTNLEFELLPVKLEHVLTIQNLPPIHKDPFDRMLVAQAKTENLTLLTSDPKIQAYLSLRPA